MSTSEVNGAPLSFWVRQFDQPVTPGQVIFDLIFGIALPLICLYYDPVVFRSSFFGQPLLGDYIIAAGTTIGLGLLTLPAWLFLRRPSALCVGLLAGGALFAFALGIVLLPFSLMGLVVFIGILGFSPFLTGFVFLRNAIRAYRKACQSSTCVPVLALTTTGLVFSCAAPWLVQWYVNHETSSAMKMVQSSDPEEAARGLLVLKRFRAVQNFDRLVFAYEAEEDVDRRQRLAEMYGELTGQDIQNRLDALLD